MSKTRYNLDLVFANIFFGANFSFYVSLTRNYLDFQQIFMLQVLSGAIFFIPFALFSKQSFRIRWRDAGNILVVTMLIVYGWMYMLLWGSSYTSPIDASIISTLGPAVTLITDHLMHPHKYIRARVVGVVCALIGAKMLGPRIGKYDKDGKPHAIPGHNLTAGALGVFILWFCWFGFNGGSSLSLSTDETMTLTGLVCFNTNLAAAVATCVTMIFTWLRYGKPDVSMTLNGSLAGLVAITAGCDAVSPFGAFLIGFVAGVLVVLSVEFFDKIAKIDDPVGAVSVHFANGVWGTIAVGLFSNGGDGVGKGLFYGGGFAQLGTQLLGLITVDVYVVAVMFIIFKIIDKTIGLRVPAEVEIDGLDIHEHGLTSAYAGFSISDANAAAMVPNENTDLGEDDASKASAVQMNAAVPVVKEPAVIHDGIYDTGMHKVSIIAKLSKFDQLKTALNDLGVTGMTVTQVMGCGIQKGTTEKYRGVPVDSTLLPKIKVEVIVSKISVDAVVDAAKKALYTGHIGDGKIFVYNVTRVVKIRTGEEDFAALQDVE